MGSFRFYRRVHIFPGASINFSKSGPSLTLGVRGAHVTLGRRGITKTVGLPGSGLYYTSRTGYHSGVHSAHADAPAGPPNDISEHRLMGWVTIAIIAAIALAIGIAIGSGLGIK
ncbi:MAG TPA: DUF4236 domain-containing protein [Candidatus Binataceae bacterium]|jgi:hypothetical protein